jgi:uncharacterized protein (TIGR02284 family)
MSPGKSDTDALTVLNQLIETCKDGEEGYRTAARCVANSDLKVLFTSYAEQRAQFAAELQAEVRRLGGDPEKSGSLVGALHRGWTNLKSSVGGADEAAIVAECERGDDMARKSYEEALGQSLPADVHAIVSRQFASVKEAHGRIHALEMAAAH